MKELEGFRFLGEMPSFDLLLAEVLCLSEEDWTGYKERKKVGGAAASHTDTIPLIYNPMQNTNSLIVHDYKELFSCYLDSVISIVKEHLGEVSVKQAMFTRLAGNTVIGRHKDKGSLTAKTHRIHVPVVTNPQCLFTIEDEVRHLESGQIWLIDNVNRYHSVENKADTDRVHLIIDAS